MRAGLVIISAISVMAVVVMIRAASRTGFTFFEVPLIVLELMFLGAVYLLWRGLAGDEDASESRRRAAPPPRAAASSNRPPTSRPTTRTHSGFRLRFSSLADWWFNGLREPPRSR